MNTYLRAPLFFASSLAFMHGAWAQMANFTSNDFKANTQVTVVVLDGVETIVGTVRATGTYVFSSTKYNNGEKLVLSGTGRDGLALTVTRGAGGKTLRIGNIVPPAKPVWAYDAGTSTIKATLSGEYNFNLPDTTFSCEDGALPPKSPVLSSYLVPAGLTTSPANDWKLEAVAITATVPAPKAGQLWACSQTDLGKNKSPVDTQVPVPVVIDAPAPATVAGAQVTLTGKASPNVDLLVLDSGGNELARATVAADGTYSVTYANPTPAAASQVSLKAINSASAAVLPTTDALYPKLFAVQTVAVPAAAVTTTPVGGADSYTTPVNTALTTAAPGVLANDTAPSGKVLTAAVATAPANGSLVLAADGSFTYTPKDKFEGADSFTYIASYDSSKAARASSNAKAAPFVDSAPVTVTINVTAGTTPPTGASAQAVPTLGHAGLVLLSGLVAGAAALRRRKPAKANNA